MTVRVTPEMRERIDAKKIEKDMEDWQKRNPDIDPLTGDPLEDDIPF